MQTHDEERDIYGVVYVQGKKYFLLSNFPSDQTWQDNWMPEGMMKWLVALDDMKTQKNADGGLGIPGDFTYYYVASTIYFSENAVIDLLPVPLTKKVIRFYVTDDEEA